MSVVNKIPEVYRGLSFTQVPGFALAQLYSNKGIGNAWSAPADGVYHAAGPKGPRNIIIKNFYSGLLFHLTVFKKIVMGWVATYEDQTILI